MTWKVSKLWKQEIPEFKIHLTRIGDHWAIRDFKSWDWYKELSHAIVNLFKEFYESFAYTLGHVTFWTLILWAILTVVL